MAYRHEQGTGYHLSLRVCSHNTYPSSPYSVLSGFYNDLRNNIIKSTDAVDAYACVGNSACLCLIDYIYVKSREANPSQYLNTDCTKSSFPLLGAVYPEGPFRNQLLGDLVEELCPDNSDPYA